MDVLLKYNYPGNIRELENIVHHSIVLSRGDVILSSDLPMSIKNLPFESNVNIANNDLTLTEQVELLEKKLVLNALKQTNNNQVQASKLLGISERNLRYRLEKWGMKNK